MTTEEAKTVSSMVAQGLGYRRIAAITGLPLNSVKTYCRRHKEGEARYDPHHHGSGGLVQRKWNKTLARDVGCN